MKLNRRKVVDVLRCKDGVAVPIKQPRVVSAIRERDEVIGKLREQVLHTQRVVGEQVQRRHELLATWWVRLGITLRLVKP
jgi:hypothetical protein